MYVNLTTREIELLIKAIKVADAQVNKYSKEAEEEKRRKCRDRQIELRKLMYKLNVYI
jgi:hypothetical protein